MAFGSLRPAYRRRLVIAMALWPRSLCRPHGMAGCASLAAAEHGRNDEIIADVAARCAARISELQQAVCARALWTASYEQVEHPPYEALPVHWRTAAAVQAARR